MTTFRRISPIRRCPAEILCVFLHFSIGSMYELGEHIFQVDVDHTYPFSIPHPRDNGSDYPLDDTVAHRREILRLVCREWNDIMEANPAFWTHIAYAGGWPHRTLGVWLERSQGMGVHVVLRLPWLMEHVFSVYGNLVHAEDITRQNVECEDLYEILYPHRHRLITFELSTACASQMVLLAQSLAPILLGKRIRTVGFHHEYSCESDIDLPIAHSYPFHSDHDSTSIRHLMLSHIQALPTLCIPRMSEITLLDIRFDDTIGGLEPIWMYFKALLNQCSSLECLRLALQFHPHLNVLHNRIEIPSLISFSVALSGVVGAQEFMAQFTLPRIRVLSITFFSYDTTANFSRAYRSMYRDGLSVSPNPSSSLFIGLERLTITSGYADRETARTVMQHLLQLRYFSLDNINGSHGRPVKFLAALLDSCIQKEISARVGESLDLCCPNLISVKTRFSSGATERKLVEARRRLASPLSCVVYDVMGLIVFSRIIS